MSTHPSTNFANLSHAQDGSVLNIGNRALKSQRGVGVEIDYVAPSNTDQLQVSETFAFMWKHRNLYETEASFRGLDEDIERFSAQFRPEIARIENEREHFRVLDAGCGSGHTGYAFFGEMIAKGTVDYLGVDISEAVFDASDYMRGLHQTAKNIAFLKSDITEIPDALGPFDVILSYGVLHHTPSVFGSIKALYQLLAPEGTLMFRIINEQKPLRQVTDTYMRDYHQRNPDPAAAFESMLPFSKLAATLGKALGDMSIDVEEAVPELGLDAGPIKVQQLLYDYVLRLYYRSWFDLERAAFHSYDWFYPTYYHETNSAELLTFLTSLGLKVKDVQETTSTISVIASKG